MKLYKFISKNTNEKGRHARSTSAPDHFHRFSELGRHELDGITHDAEAVVAFDRERSVTHALAVLVLLPNRYRLAVGTEERLTRFEIDAHGALVGNLLAVLVERIGERPDSPHRGLADIPEFGADRIPHFLELIGELHEFTASEQEAHHVVRPLAAGVLGVDAHLVEAIDHLVPRCLELSEKLHEGALLGRLDDHDTARVILALHALLLGFPIQTLHRNRYRVGVRETELQCDQTDSTIQCDHGGPPFGWIVGLLYTVLPAKYRDLRAKLRKVAYGKELYFSTASIADYIELVKPNEATKKTFILGLFSIPFLIKIFSFLLSVKTWFEPIVFPGSLAVLKSRGEAAPNSRGVPRRRRRRNAFGLIQEYCTSKEIASFEGSPRFARRLIRIGFWGQKRIGDFERRKEKFLIKNLTTL